MIENGNACKTTRYERHFTLGIDQNYLRLDYLCIAKPFKPKNHNLLPFLQCFCQLKITLNRRGKKGWAMWAPMKNWNVAPPKRRKESRAHSMRMGGCLETVNC